MPMTTDGVQDMYYPNDFDYDAYTQDCWDTFKMKPDYDYTLNHFGGVTNEEYLSASRIIFTNGGLDPWSGASPRSDLSESLKACFMRISTLIKQMELTIWTSVLLTLLTLQMCSSAVTLS